MRNIGIVCEGPTDYTILKEVIDHITGESNDYVQLQPEADLTGAYGNGWKGVWKWCRDNAACKEKLMRAVEPSLDLLIIQMDGDVSRKEKIAHCLCNATKCEYKGKYHPLECDSKKEIRESCPIVLPCAEHKTSVNAYIRHLEQLIIEELQDMSDTCIVIPCDSTESWIVELMTDWKTQKKKMIHGKISLQRKKCIMKFESLGNKKESMSLKNLQ